MTKLPPQAPDDNNEHPLCSEQAVGTSSEKVVVNWGFGLIPPFSLNPPPRGTQSTRQPPRTVSHAIRVATYWTVRHLCRLRILHVEHTPGDHQLSDPRTVTQRVEGTDVRDTS
jgi:hypothetical protein